MLSNKEITRLARESLAGKWLFMALVTFVYTVVMGASSQVPLLMITGSCLIAGAMGVGYFSVCLRVARDQEIQLTDLFSGFKIFGRAFLLYLLVLIFLMLWTLLLFVPGVIAILRYSFVYLVAADEPSLSAVEIIQRSKRLTYGYKWQISAPNPILKHQHQI